MSTINALKKEITALKASINPDPKHFIIQFGFGTLDDPHSWLGENFFHIDIDAHGNETKWVEAVTDYEAELAAHKKYYDKLAGPRSKFMKSSDHPFQSFESFLEYCRCTCGKHGVDGKQPYMGESAEKCKKVQN
jgi:hypothetical protein